MMIFDIYRNAGNSPVVQLVVIAVVLDTVFGCIRAAKDRQFNSCFGINGAIRKIGMVVSILALILVDQIVQLNWISAGSGACLFRRQNRINRVFWSSVYRL